MKNLKLTATGDLRMVNGDFEYITGKDLLTQTVKQVVATNKGEWELNRDEGINFAVMLVKNPNFDEILDTIRDGLTQVDETFVITAYEFEQKADRQLDVYFTAENEQGEEITVQSVQLVGISVSSMPTKTVYRHGDEFDDTGLEVVAVYSDDSEEFLDEYIITGFNSEVYGTQSVEISYQGFTTHFNVEVLEPEETTVTDYIYATVAGSHAELYRYKGTETYIKTPQTIDGLPVTVIAGTCFSHSCVENVVISSGVTTIS